MFPSIEEAAYKPSLAWRIFFSLCWLGLIMAVVDILIFKGKFWWLAIPQAIVHFGRKARYHSTRE